MDYPITNRKSNRVKLWKAFHYLDIIPYSLAILMIFASLYIISMTIELTRCPH